MTVGVEVYKPLKSPPVKHILQAPPSSLIVAQQHPLCPTSSTKLFLTPSKCNTFPSSLSPSPSYLPPSTLSPSVPASTTGSVTPRTRASSETQRSLDVCLPSMIITSLAYAYMNSKIFTSLLGNVYDDGCNVVDSLTTTTNPCDSGTFSCTGSPITFNGYTNTFSGQQSVTSPFSSFVSS